ncbi:transposase [Vibrio mimicus]|uniref:transposase n=1 Tax=Vibrio mimicus TaxID=674 RepID=UPI003A932460
MKALGVGTMGRCKYYTSSHSVYYTKYHGVWAMKYRRKILTPGMCSNLRKPSCPSYCEVCLVSSLEIETIGFDEEHLHMMMLIPSKSKSCISDNIGKLKSQLSHHVGITFSWLNKVD